MIYLFCFSLGIAYLAMRRRQKLLLAAALAAGVSCLMDLLNTYGMPEQLTCFFGLMENISLLVLIWVLFKLCMGGKEDTHE